MFPFICTNVSDGIRNVDQGLVEMARFYRVDNRRILTGYIPAVMPLSFQGHRVPWGSDGAIIIGEVLSQPVYGIGIAHADGSNVPERRSRHCLTLIAVLISFAFENLFWWEKSTIIQWKAGS